jgi:hypothetical protein
MPCKSTHSTFVFGKTGIELGSTLVPGPAILRGQYLNAKIPVACIDVGGKGSSDVTEIIPVGCIAQQLVYGFLTLPSRASRRSSAGRTGAQRR